jgi:trimethylguanosine synthase
MNKYWYQRYSLFSKYDEGIVMDETGWYSVTPEAIAIWIADELLNTLKDTDKDTVIIDAFCGVGGNAIQFAKHCKVIAIDISLPRLKMAQSNALIYGVSHNIEFIHGDFMQLAGSLKADAVFLSPPWGGPSYLQMEQFDIDTMMTINGTLLFEVSKLISNNICYYLPRTTQVAQLQKLGPVRIKKVHLNDKCKCICAYYS